MKAHVPEVGPEGEHVAQDLPVTRLFCYEDIKPFQSYVEQMVHANKVSSSQGGLKGFTNPQFSESIPEALRKSPEATTNTLDILAKILEGDNFKRRFDAAKALTRQDMVQLIAATVGTCCAPNT